MAADMGKLVDAQKGSKVGILTVSDSCFHGAAQDKSGPNLREIIEKGDVIHGQVTEQSCVPDEQDQIKSVLSSWCDEKRLDLILTTGGTGLAPRDVTPEATRSVLEKEALGLTLAMLQGSLKVTPMAMLSRPACGVRGRTLIVNLPGSKKASQECLGFLSPALGHALDLLGDRQQQIAATHSSLQNEQAQAWCSEGIYPDHNPILPSSPPSTSSLWVKDLASSQPNHPPHGVEHEETVGQWQSVHHFHSDVRPDNRGYSESGQQDLEEENQASPDGGWEIHRISGFNQQALCKSEMGQLEETEESEEHRDICNEGSKDATIVLVEVGGQVVQSMSVNNFVMPSRRDEENRLEQVQDEPPEELGKPEHTVEVFEFHDICADSEQSISESIVSETDTSRGKKRKHNSESESKVLTAKVHKRKDSDWELYIVPVGQDLKVFLANHTLIRGLYLNRGKRKVKKHLVQIKRQESAVDMGSWQRQGNIHERCRLDDFFELTSEGLKKKQLVLDKYVRDEYVVNWYLWCPGHGNCQRKCGGLGKCEPGCKGMQHKQDRHNCSVLLNLKIYLSDLTQWHVYLSGSHVPLAAKIMWQPPPRDVQRMDEDTKDLIVAYHEKVSTSQMLDILVRKQKPIAPDATPETKKRLTYVLSSMKKRRQTRDYNYAQTVASSREDGGNEDENLGVSCEKDGTTEVTQFQDILASGESVAFGSYDNESEEARSNQGNPGAIPETYQVVGDGTFLGTSRVKCVTEPLVHSVVQTDSQPCVFKVQQGQIQSHTIKPAVSGRKLVTRKQRRIKASEQSPSINQVTVVQGSEDERSYSLVQLAKGANQQELANLGDIGTLLEAACQHQNQKS